MKNMQKSKKDGRHESTNYKKPGVIILISEKVDFWTNNIMKDKAEYCITMKGSIIQET